MNEIKTKFLQTLEFQPLVWFRYIDDVLFTWAYGPDKLVSFDVFFTCTNDPDSPVSFVI